MAETEEVTEFMNEGRFVLLQRNLQCITPATNKGPIENRIGITNHAQEQLGDVVFVELPAIGKKVAKGVAGFGQDQLAGKDDKKDASEADKAKEIVGSALSKAAERVFEAYYNIGVTKFSWLTLDYQRVANPAYNSDRGPVNIYGFRVHAEF